MTSLSGRSVELSSGSNSVDCGDDMTLRIPRDTLAYRLWAKITEPRVIAVLLFCQYVVFAAGGLYALFYPPTSIQGQIGTNSMAALAALLVFGGTLGAIAALPGIWWLERSAVLSVGWAALLYLGIVVGLHVGGDGNRLLQAAFVTSVLLHQGVRWVRIRERSYRPEVPGPGIA